MKIRISIDWERRFLYNENNSGRVGYYPMAYKGFTDAQARAHKKYMEKTATIQIFGTAEWREEIKAAASAAGESVNGYIKRAIDERMGKAHQIVEP